MTIAITRAANAHKGTIILAHGAGAGSDSDFMQAFQAGLHARGFEVILFDFPYMQRMKTEGKRRPPGKADKLISYYRDIIQETKATGPLLIGGKSMGGRIASMLLADDPKAADGLLLLGYPFHPPGKPDKLRTEHLPHILCPTLIVQGEKDTFGGKALVDTLSLPTNFTVSWSPDGDHSLKPRKASGLTEADNRKAAMDTIAAFKWS